ncbi:putative RNA-directed DNA polymerase, eukaryota, reverse transcriptase zinc-binding domain protein [Tanacetum coccineum]
MVQKKKKKLFIFKVDFEKAFDLVSWKYLDFVLLNLAFGSKWRSWIRACLSSSRASVLVNGSPTLEFPIKRGLRQGDPLSPFLFIFVMEGLHNALSTAVSSCLIRGVKFGSPEVTISHLFYADDVIITTEWNASDLENIIRVLQVFYFASGLKINIQKSNVYGIGVSDVDVSFMASNSGCALGSFPFTYLGLPISSNMSLTSSWQPRYLLLLDLQVLKILTSSFSKSVVGGCYRTRMLSGLKLSRLYMVRKVAFISMVAIITSEKACLIIDCIDHGQWRWNWSRPNLGARNSADLLDMLFKISSAEINEVEDTCVWSLGTDGTFSVKDARCIIDSKILPSLAPSTVWDKNIPRKVNIFIWRLILDRLPHKLNLSSRGIDFRRSLVPLAMVVKEKSWRLSVNFSSSLWWLWRYRNSVTFHSHPMRKSDIFDNILLSSYSWLHHRGHMICNWIDWLKSPMLLSGNGLG